MVNRDEVFVITEDDILKSPDRGKNKAAASRGAPISLAKNSAKAGRGEGDSAPEPVSSVERDKSSGRRRNPAAAGTLSLWVWGLGQLYNGDTKLAILLKKAIWVGMGVLFCTALSWLISAYDATLVARYTRKA